MKFRTKIMFFDEGEMEKLIKTQIESLRDQIKGMAEASEGNEAIKTMVASLQTTIEGLQTQLTALQQKTKDAEDKKIQDAKDEAERLRLAQEEEDKKKKEKELPEWYKNELKKRDEEALASAKSIALGRFPKFEAEINACETISELSRLSITLEKTTTISDEQVLAELKKKDQSWRDQHNLVYKKEEKTKTKEEKAMAFLNKFKKQKN